MIIGSYPCCDESFMLTCPERTPVFVPEDCPHCGTRVWHRFSRLDPQSWTEEEFLKVYAVDHETKKITELNPKPKEDVELTAWDRQMIKAMSDWLLYGGSGPIRLREGKDELPVLLGDEDMDRISVSMGTEVDDTPALKASYEYFVREQMKAIAAGVDLPYDQVIGSFRKANDMPPIVPLLIHKAPTHPDGNRAQRRKARALARSVNSVTGAPQA